MDLKKRQALEAAGWRFGDAADFLGLTDEERQEVELRGALCRTIRRRREALGMTQQQLANRLGSSQSRVAKLEIGVGVSLDLMFRALFALGGGVADLAQPKVNRRRRQAVRS
ncbi:MAG: XRE family transcriptional regulator [Planctomycetia bacterium]|jgi:predicted XRE-type DNA-binding protein|nr:XRE family transcriptional regulator [Planctomycetia bacterium]